jgi:tRNA-binding EMAP/Myf-like protein
VSQFTVPVVRINKIEKHPNADSLSITEVEGCPVIFQTAGIKLGDLAVYVPVDAVVPLTNPEFAFLATKEGQQTARIKAKKLRGIFSMGLLMPVSMLPGDPSQHLGEDVAEVLGIVKYEEPEPNLPLNRTKPKTRFQRVVKFLLQFQVFRFFMRFDWIKNLVLEKKAKADPGVPCPVYDVESYRKYKGTLIEGEPVIVTEKIHGCNARFTFRVGPGEKTPRLFIGSHNQFKSPNATSVWHDIAAKLDLTTKLNQPVMADRVLYGEVFGKVQDLKYGATAEEPLKFAAFDIFDIKAGRFLDYNDFKAVCGVVGIPVVPTLYEGPYKPEIVEPLARGQSLFANPKQPQIREGIVIKPVTERWERGPGRVILKLISEDYLLRKGGTELH